MEEKNSFKAFLGWTGAATATKQCNMWIHAFNRLPKSERPCAIIFEEDDCDTDDGVLIRDWYLEVKPKNKLEPPKNKRSKRYLQESIEYAVNQAKFERGREWAADHGCEFIVITERELKIRWTGKKSKR